MRTKYLRIVSLPIMPIGNFRSLPAEVGSPFPVYPVLPPRPMEHPQAMSWTSEVGIPPMEPANNSTLATEYPPESPADPAASV